MPLPCVKTENRVKDVDEALVQLIKNEGSYRKTPHYAKLLQRFIVVSTEDQEHFANKACSVCRDRCCKNVNHLHLADILRYYFSVPRMWFVPEFDKAREIEDKRSRDEPCRYYSELGCVLNRRVRPLICAQFICDVDRALPVVGNKLLAIGKAVRLAMEDVVKLFHIEIGICDSERLEDVTKRLQLYEDTLAEYEAFRR